MAAIILLVDTVAILTIQSYRGAQALLRDNATTLSQRIQGELTTKIHRILASADSELDILVHSDLPLASEISQRLAEVPLLLSTLKARPLIESAYVGYADGSFILFRPIATDRAVAPADVPPGSALLVQTITRDDTGHAVAEYRYFDDKAQLLRVEARTDYVFDPRQRPWYGAAQAASDTIVTEPYVFFTSRMVGTTVARRAPGGVAVAGVDVALVTLASALNQLRITPRTELAILGQDDRVVGYHDATRLFVPAIDGRVSLPTVGELGAPALARARDLLDRSDVATDLTIDGRDWRAMRSDLVVHGQAFKLLLAIPTDEMFAGARAVLRSQLLMAAAILILAVVAGWWGARALSRPIRQLALETRAIGALDFRPTERITSSIAEVESLARALGTMKSTIRKFVRIGQAMATERHLPALLDRVLAESLRVADAKGGAIYLLDEEQRSLAPQAMRWRDGRPEDRPSSLPTLLPNDPALPRPLVELLAQGTGRIREWVASTDELQALGFTPVAVAASAPGFRLLALPFLDRSSALIGVLVMALPGREDAGADGEPLRELLTAIGSGAGIAIENQRLFQAQKDLMNALIKLIAGAIDAKSSHTGGHCQRVPALTTMLAQAACAEIEGPFAEFRLSDDEWEAVTIGAWLHDCGKVTTPEHVVDKATKLETIYDRIHEVRMRFEVLKRDAEIEYWRSLAKGGAEPAHRAALDAAWRRLDEEFAFVAACNQGGEHLDDDRVARLREIGSRRWRRTLDDRLGTSQEERRRRERTGPASLPVDEPLVADADHHISHRRPEEMMAEENAWGIKVETPPHRFNRGELYNLSVRRGTLTKEERYIINDHMTQTIMMLQSLPFPKHLRAVPEIAGGHHERMDGTGYPKRLRREQMSPVARMMAIADVFEALTASDRPYKQPMPVSEALRIMAIMKRDHHLDPDLLDLFARSGTWKVYAERFLSPAQLDEPDLEFLLKMRPADHQGSATAL